MERRLVVVARVRAAVARATLVARAVLVVQEDEADADRAEGEAGDEPHPLRGREPADLVEHLARGLGRGLKAGSGMVIMAPGAKTGGEAPDRSLATAMDNARPPGSVKGPVSVSCPRYAGLYSYL